jgi:N-acyl-D-amino-acid deacylase
MMKSAITFSALLISASMCSTALGQNYDIVILNGRVMDPETKFDAIRNVGVKDGKIVTITEKAISGEETIDAKDHVVAPGFIDTHTHSSDKFSVKMSMMDGVTTGLDLELGALNIADWYERENGKWPMNYGQAVGHEYVRMMVHDGLKFDNPIDAVDVFNSRAAAVKDDGNAGWSVTKSSLEQINQITRILDENLRQGALGIGSTPGYASQGITTYELFEVQRAAAHYKRWTGFHTRFHCSGKTPQEAQLGFAEVFTNACLLRAPLLICHDNDYGWWEIEEKLQMARAMGMNMWAEYYPYASGSSAISADGYKPESVEGALGLKYEEMMFDPIQNKYLTKEEYLKVVKQDPGRTVIGFNPVRKEWMPYWLKMPHMTVGSDAMWATEQYDWDDDPAKYVGHPRTSGTHTKVLRMAREEKVPLMFTLAQLSYWSAKHLGDAGLQSMQVRGRLQEGMVADIVVFDAEQVKEGSGYQAGTQGLPPIGLPHVIVNGVFVKRDNNATDNFPGLPIRFPVEDKPRHVPASQEQWLQTHSIDGGALVPRPTASTGRENVRQVSQVKHQSLRIESRPALATHALNGEHNWWGDQRYHALGYCCEWHMLKARFGDKD